MVTSDPYRRREYWPRDQTWSQNKFSSFLELRLTLESLRDRVENGAEEVDCKKRKETVIPGEFKMPHPLVFTFLSLICPPTSLFKWPVYLSQRTNCRGDERSDSVGKLPLHMSSETLQPLTPPFSCSFPFYPCLKPDYCKVQTLFNEAVLWFLYKHFGNSDWLPWRSGNYCLVVQLIGLDVIQFFNDILLVGELFGATADSKQLFMVTFKFKYF